MAAVRKSCRAPAPAGFKYVPPDGGFGWWVLVGTCLAGGIVVVPLTSFGFFFVDILNSMQTSTSTCSWIPSICISASMLIAPVANIIITKYSCRVATMCGGILASVGMILSYFATNVIVLFFTFGVIYGAGFGFVTSATVLVLSEYFRDHYGFVTGISFAFFAAGKLIFSPIVQLMLEIMDFHGVFLVLGALCLNVCVGGALFQPSVRHQKLIPIPEPVPAPEPEVNNGKTVVSNNHLNSNGRNSINGNGNANFLERNGNLRSRSSSCNGAADDPSVVWLLQSEVANRAVSGKPEVVISSSEVFGSVQSVTLHDEPEKMVTVVSEEPKKEEEAAGCYSWWKNGPLKLDIKLLSEPIFHILMWAGMLASVVSVYQGVYLPSMMVENGLLRMQAATAMSFKAGGEIAGRVVTPYVKEFFKIPLLPLYYGLLIVQIGYLILITFMTSFASVVIVTVVGGLSSGGYTGIIMLIYVDSVGYGRLSSVIALTKFIQGVLVVGVGPLIGFVKDVVGAFDVCFYILAVVQFICFLMWLLQPLAKRKSFVT